MIARLIVSACAVVLAVDVLAALCAHEWRHAAVGTAALVWLGMSVSDRTDLV